MNNIYDMIIPTSELLTVQNIADRSSSDSSAFEGTVANMTMGWKSTWNSCSFCFCCRDVSAAVPSAGDADVDVDADALLRRLCSAGIGGRGGGGRRLW